MEDHRKEFLKQVKKINLQYHKALDEYEKQCGGEIENNWEHDNAVGVHNALVRLIDWLGREHPNYRKRRQEWKKGGSGPEFKKGISGDQY